MTFEVIVAAGVVVIMAAVLIVAFILTFRSGQNDTVKKDLKDATQKQEKRNDPMPTDAEYVSRLRRAQERLARLRDRATKR